jgi:hypothetical protein
MIKKLIFTIALLSLTVAPLTPRLAYGQNPSASFTDQVVPAGSDPTPSPPPPAASGPTPCDIGTPYTGSIPAAAAQAGFTHCVANYDFTQTQSFTSCQYPANSSTLSGCSTSYQWSNIGSWLWCPGTYSPTQPLLWEGSTPQANCARFTIVTDALNGLQALQVQYTPDDTNNSTLIQTNSSSGWPNSQGVHIMHGAYVEEVTRIATDWTQYGCSNCQYFGTWQTQANGSCSSCGYFEDDLDEQYADPYGGSCGGSRTGATLNYQNCAQGSNANISGYNRETWQTYGMLTTVLNTSSGNNYQTCYVFNNQSTGVCGAMNATTAQISEPTYFYYLASVGPYTAGLPPIPVAEVVNIERFTIWACAGYGETTSGTPCYTSSLITY